MSHKAVHADFLPPNRHAFKYEKEPFQPPVTWVENPEAFRDVPRWVKNQRNSRHGVEFAYYMNLDLEKYYKRYCETLLAVDESVGKLVDAMEEKGVLDNTLVLYLGDNGYLFGEHGLANHGASVWEQLYSTPCLIRYPKAIPAGTVVRGLTSALDLMPTAFSLIGKEEWLADRTTLDGEPLRLDTQVDPDRTLIVDAPPAVLPERFKQYPKLLYLLSIIARAARTSEFKYIWQSNGQKLLFRTGTPEDDQHNVLEEYPEIADNLHSRMVAFYETVDPEFVIEQYPVCLLYTSPSPRD